jgi:hypothetical protein
MNWERFVIKQLRIVVNDELERVWKEAAGI